MLHGTTDLPDIRHAPSLAECIRRWNSTPEGFRGPIQATLAETFDARMSSVTDRFPVSGDAVAFGEQAVALSEVCWAFDNLAHAQQTQTRRNALAGAINMRGRRGWTVLHNAVQEGWEDVAAQLLDHGAVPGAKTELGWTALHGASEQGFPSIVRLLVAAGAPVNEKDNDERSAAFVAAAQGNLEVLDALEAANADMSTVDGRGWDLLRVATSQGHEPVVARLLGCHVPLDRLDMDQTTALFDAVRHNHGSIAAALVRAGARTDVTSVQGTSITDMLATRPVMTQLFRNMTQQLPGAPSISPRNPAGPSRGGTIEEPGGKKFSDYGQPGVVRGSDVPRSRHDSRRHRSACASFDDLRTQRIR